VYPKLDSVVWSGRSTSVSKVLSFDPEGGTLTVITAEGHPGRLDLRFGEAATVSRDKLSAITSINGSDIYGITPKGTITRISRSGDWTYTPPTAARFVFPQLDGGLLIAAQKGNEARIWKVYPPETKLIDTITLSMKLPSTRAQAGDRVYFGTDTGLVGVAARTMAVATPISLDHRVTAIAPTPSGDRVFVTTEGEQGLSVIDRYTDRVSNTIDLPGEVSEIRMDPLGRYVIAKPMHGDSAWVIAIATDRVVGSIHTKWSEDLPVAAPDGAIAINNGHDVVFLDGETLQSVRTIPDGAKDYWYFMFWNGFRPHETGTEARPPAEQPDTAISEPDTTSTIGLDTGVQSVPTPAVPAESTSRTPPVPTPVPNIPVQPIRPQQPTTFTVSFAALLNEQRAQELAKTIIVNGVKARVVRSERAGTPIYRVVLGPYPTHEAADQVGRDSKRQYWIYAGEP
jgi:cell division septation protein DedD